MVGYTKDIPAENVDEVAMIEYAAEINAWFEHAFQTRMKKGATFRLLDMMPLCLKSLKETELIPVPEEEKMRLEMIEEKGEIIYFVSYPQI